MHKRKKLLVILAALLVAYAGSYYWLSRRAYAEAKQYNMEGFYYFLPEHAQAWRIKNYACVYLFFPLNWIDRALGSGRSPAREPLWELGEDHSTRDKF
jgi:hypothetical protein